MNLLTERTEQYKKAALESRKAERKEDENDPTLLAELDEVMNSGEEGEEEGKKNKQTFFGFLKITCSQI